MMSYEERNPEIKKALTHIEELFSKVRKQMRKEKAGESETLNNKFGHLEDKLDFLDIYMSMDISADVDTRRTVNPLRLFEAIVLQWEDIYSRRGPVNYFPHGFHPIFVTLTRRIAKQYQDYIPASRYIGAVQTYLHSLDNPAPAPVPCCQHERKPCCKHTCTCHEAPSC